MISTKNLISTLLFLSLFFATFIAVGCSEKKGGNNATAFKESFNNGACLDVKQMELMFQIPLAQTPISVLTTNFEVIKSESPAINALMAYKVFGVHETLGRDIGLTAPVAEQVGCEAVHFRVAGGPLIEFKISESSLDHLKLSLVENSSIEPLPDIRRAALDKTPQVLSYDFQLLSPNKIAMKATYKTINPVCNTSQTFHYQVEKIIEWKTDRAQMTENLKTDFVNRYVATLENPPAMSLEGPLTVDQVKQLASLNIRPELKLCP